jgi:HD-like signal output (HDOD) protein
MPEKYKDAQNLAQAEGITLHEAERRIFMGAHSSVGAYLIGLWGFTSPIMEAIGFHHSISLYPSKTFSPAHAVHIANIMYYQNRPKEILGKEITLDIEELGDIASPEKIKKWQQICSEYMATKNE